MRAEWIGVYCLVGAIIDILIAMVYYRKHGTSRDDVGYAMGVGMIGGVLWVVVAGVCIVHVTGRYLLYPLMQYIERRSK